MRKVYSWENIDKKWAVFGHLFMIASRQQALMDQTIDILTARQWTVIIMLIMLAEPPTLRQLADVCDSSHQNIRLIVNKLEKKGFVTIEKDASDARSLRILMTEKYDQWLPDYAERIKSFKSTMFSDLSVEELNTLCRLLLTVYERLGKMKKEMAKKL